MSAAPALPLAMPRPGWDEERAFWREGIDRVAGVDEVGRGPLAGPVFAAAVVLPRTPSGRGSTARWIGRLRDSKVLTAGVREELAAIIRRECDWGIAHVSAQVVDQINILQATRLAMRLAVEALPAPPAALIIDGNERVDGSLLQRSVPDALRGRLSALHIVVVAGGPRLGDFEAGLVAQVFTPPVSVVSGGVACVAGVAVIGLLVPRFARYRAGEPA
jgi:hypothetical protein